MIKETLLTYVLPVLLWGGITGIINLAFGYKSQIEAWAESHPRLAALLKFTRGIGLDPWHLLSALKLFAQKKLPDAQKAGSAVSRNEQRKADAKRLDPDGTARITPLLVLLFAGLLGLSQQGCAAWTAAKPVLRDTNDVARELCRIHFGGKSKLSPEDVVKTFCETRDDLAPWIEAVLAAKQGAARKAEARRP